MRSAQARGWSVTVIHFLSLRLKPKVVSQHPSMSASSTQSTGAWVAFMATSGPMAAHSPATVAAACAPTDGPAQAG